mmetsp:Transcript_45857/g.33609  ORF Transcript_45857/g.33609 Transcript_45857/m.33609 type:complete len:152 (+) Transcript_45857:29-484(+)
MQLMDSLYGRHTVACVWFIKYMTENIKVLEELLLNSSYFEVREAFAKLLMTTMSSTAKNEESYFNEDEEIIEVENLNSYPEKKYISKAAIVRFMDQYFNNMLDTVRVHWRRYEEYFHVLSHFASQGFIESQYMILNCRGIYRLLEFVCNCN